MYKKTSRLRREVFYFCLVSKLPESKIHYCVSDILNCTPALVFTTGALDEI